MSYLGHIGTRILTWFHGKEYNQKTKKHCGVDDTLLDTRKQEAGSMVDEPRACRFSLARTSHKAQVQSGEGQRVSSVGDDPAKRLFGWDRFGDIGFKYMSQSCRSVISIIVRSITNGNITI
jgi:hypothetical protein